MYLSKKPSKTPSADEPIHPSDRFAKAKRNALFWITTTILLSIGSSDPNTPVEVSGVVRNFGFLPNALLTGSLTVLLFMLAGYRRSEKHLLAQHSHFALQHRMEEVTEVADRLIDQLEDWHSKAQKFKSEASATASVVQERHDSAKERLKDCKSSVPYIANWLKEFGLAKVDGRIIQKEAVSAEKLLAGASILEAELEGLRQSFDRAYTDVSGVLVINVDDELKRREDAITAIEEDAAKLATNLRKFSTAIGAGERRWFWLHDRMPVWGGTAVAVFLAYWRFHRPDSLDATLSSLFT